MLTSSQINLLRAHRNVVKELHSEGKTKNRLSRTFRTALTEVLEVSNHPQTSSITCQVSVQAMKIIKENGLPRSWFVCTRLGLRYEHAVPLSILYEIIGEAFDRDCSDVEVQELIARYLVPTWVTLEEDAALNRGLKSKMPAGWKNGDDAFARYTAVGIDIEIA